MDEDTFYMTMALEEAHAAYEAGEVPVGAVITNGSEVIARGHNNPIGMKDPTAHAEIVAIRKAAVALGNYRLVGTTLYSTVEPCVMCAAALVQARIDRLVFGAKDPKGGAVVSLFNICSDPRLNHFLDIKGGVLALESREILSRFFREKRVCSPSVIG